MRTLALVAVLLSSNLSINAQQKTLKNDESCGTPDITIEEGKKLPWYGNNAFLSHYVDSLKQVFAGNPTYRVEGADVWYRVPIRFIMTEWDGVNALLKNPAETDRIYKTMVQSLNDAMRRNNVPIRFYMLCVETFEQWDAVYGTVDCPSFPTRRTDGALDCYIVNDDGSGVYCWRGRNNSPIIVERNSISSFIYQEDNVNPTNTTFIHEIGHWLGLQHTHNLYDVVCVDEQVTRGWMWSFCSPVPNRQCEFRGDFLCDTEADPKISRFSSSNVVNCTWVPGYRDNRGEQFRPDPRNFMSYGSDCRTIFTEQQKAVMLYEVTQNNPNYPTTFAQDFDTYEPDNTPAMGSPITLNGAIQEHSFDIIGNTVRGGCIDDNDWIRFYNDGTNINDLYLDVTSPSGLIAAVEFWNTNNVAAGIEKVNQIPLTTMNLGGGKIRYVIPCSLLSGTGSYLFRIVRSGTQIGQYTVALKADLPVISGPSTFCRNSGGFYTISPVPTGATITWVSTGGLNIRNGQGTSYVFVTGYDGTIQATITGCSTSYTTPIFNISTTFPPGLGVNYTHNNGSSMPLLLYAPSDTGVPNPNNICLGYTNRGYLIAGVSAGTVIFTAISGATTSYRDNRSVYLNISPGAVGIVQVTATNNCGTETQTVAFKITNCGYPDNPSDPTNPPNPCNGAPKIYNISPNPASGQIKIGVTEKPIPIECPTNPYPPKMQLILDSKEGITFSEVNVYNSFGILVLSQKTNKAKEFTLPLKELRAGLYLVQISEGEYIERHQIIIE